MRALYAFHLSVTCKTIVMAHVISRKSVMKPAALNDGKTVNPALKL